MDQSEVNRLETPQAVARAQQQAFEWKPWQPGFPLQDVLGNRLCYLDHGAHIDSRYWVRMEGERGAHIRKGIGGSFNAFGITRDEAESIGAKYAQQEAQNGMSSRLADCYQRSDGYFCAVYTCWKTLHI